MPHVVTVFLRHGGRVLLARRSEAVGTYQGRWAGVSGYVEGDPADAERDARRELAEEVGVREADAELVRAGEPLAVADEGREWTVHPFLFDAGSRDVDPNEELAEVEWVHPTEMRERETVPGLWAAYRRVAPGVETVADDEAHGSAWISLRALEVLRDAAVEADSRDALASVARRLRDARPSMAAVENRVNRVMAESGPDPESVRQRAEAAIDDAAEADGAAAARAAELIGDRGYDRLATLSRSGTVLAALEASAVAEAAVLVAESRPGGEGVGVAERLARGGRNATLTTDAALPGLVAGGEADAVFLGADSVLASGGVVNKVGSLPVALAAARADVPVFAVCARDKVRGDDRFVGENAGTLYDGEAAIETANPLFEVVSADLLSGVVTESGVLDADGVEAVAAEHAALAARDD
ncbi:MULTISPECIES: NUDIX domain-containing protein [Haloferax]|uniref:Methylthioribose-1-phosphate isomerase n=1 Tax=Haloferax massiliensis TaxID=1476858 RepID=A0A0D6JLY6_9EURY|nr:MULTISPECIES: NUDIX domain-containing protein [Haloferax]MDS0242989.1 NUDIX domain-containing protein [Haloferax sp. S2CR25]MDS0446110.1 NUDIX domain-containing protein [Haloferax sp. S2CR25-2]CQR48874.1 Methylthioribose-1-phosphate isomerase [Haloferax massiliensis]